MQTENSILRMSMVCVEKEGLFANRRQQLVSVMMVSVTIRYNANAFLIPEFFPFRKLSAQCCIVFRFIRQEPPPVCWTLLELKRGLSSL